ncbi:MAG TPA: DUF2845 domain-containing protein [Steroidobacteraceae bacterium]|nr:DUF2845 domain-containing protein [Steroidobacteraceae bacterium]
MNKLPQKLSANIRAMKSLWGFVGATLIFPFAATADETFRCGKWLASSEMSVEDLLKKCGEPRTREKNTQDVLARNQYGLMVKVDETVSETWTYDRGANPAMVVTIIDGSIKRIERKK